MNKPLQGVYTQVQIIVRHFYNCLLMCSKLKFKFFKVHLPGRLKDFWLHDLYRRNTFVSIYKYINTYIKYSLNINIVIHFSPIVSWDRYSSPRPCVGQAVRANGWMNSY